MKIAVLLPTLSPELAKPTIESFAEALRAFPDSEIVVVSQTEVEGPKVRWVREAMPRGTVQAQIAAFAATDAELLIAASDEVRARPDTIDRAVRFLLDNEPPSAPYLAGLHYIQPDAFPFGTLGTVYGFYYPYFPIARRRTIEAVGGWYDPGFHSFWAPSDLALRIWNAEGGRCELTPGCVDLIRGRDVPAESAAQFELLQRDMAGFQSRWQPLIGQGWGTAMRDFNIDLRPHLPLLNGMGRDDIDAVQKMVRAEHRRAI